ncbi:MAG TPA: response regulator transcription factor [Dehalococcoidia bacterium]|nr:response regulator transcription factor [Dehalococcoidia bacterium]
MEPINVLIVDDHQVVREGLRAMIEGEEGIYIAGEACDGAEALTMTKELTPSVVLMDIRMPKMDGLEATRRMKSLYPTASVVMISVYDNDAYIIDAIRAGAAGYILKDVSKDLLVHTIKAVNAGGVLLKSSLLHRALKGIGPSESEVHREGLAPPPDGISMRELDVLRLVVEGLTNKQIANRLSLAEDTVKKHVQSLIAKLQASDRTQAAVKAVRAGIIPEISKS